MVKEVILVSNLKLDRQLKQINQKSSFLPNTNILFIKS